MASEACPKDPMYIKTQDEFKTAASALRRELKALGLDTGSHAATQELLAKALGHTSYAALKPKLPTASKSSEPSVPKYPLRNVDGRYDLVPKEESGIPIRGWGFDAVQGTSEVIPNCTSFVYEVTRCADNSFSVMYSGDMFMNYDEQRTETNDQGVGIWLSEGGNKFSAHFLIVAPEDFDPDCEAEDEEYLVRENLVNEYVLLSRERGVQEALLHDIEANGRECPALEELSDTLCFSLHAQEVQRLVERLKG